jgi:hypothetical protein
MSIADRAKMAEFEKRLRALEEAFAESSKRFAQQVNDETFDALSTTSRPTLTLPEKRKSA